MAAKIILIADAIVAALNDKAFSLAFTAARRYRPMFTSQQLNTLQVSVVAAALERSVYSRADDLKQYTVDIGVQKRAGGLDTAKDAEYDGLMVLVEEIVEFLNRKKFTYPDVRVAVIENEPVYDAPSMKERSEFISVIRVHLENRKGL